MKQLKTAKVVRNAIASSLNYTPIIPKIVLFAFLNVHWLGKWNRHLLEKILSFLVELYLLASKNKGLTIDKASSLWENVKESQENKYKLSKKLFWACLAKKNSFQVLHLTQSINLKNSE